MASALPTIKTLMAIGLTEEQAKQIRREAGRVWGTQPQTSYGFAKVLHATAQMLGDDVQSIRLTRDGTIDNGYAELRYVNRGGTYDLTLAVEDAPNRYHPRLIVTTWGDWVEYWESRGFAGE